MAETTTAKPTAKPRTFRFTGRGNFEVVLKGSYRRVITDAAGNVLTTRFEPAIIATFNNGYFETKDPQVAELLQQEAGWGSDFFWCATEPEATGKEEIAKNIDEEKVARAKYMKKARQRRIENGPADRS